MRRLIHNPLMHMDICIVEFFLASFTISEADSNKIPTTGIEIYSDIRCSERTLYSELLESVIVSNDCQMS